MSCECNQTAYEKILASEAVRHFNEIERRNRDEIRSSYWEQIYNNEHARAEAFDEKFNGFRAMTEEEINEILV